MTKITYQSIMDQINKLKVQAEKLNIEKKVVHTRKKPDIKYRHPVTGANWTGRGKIPNWIKESGQSKEVFLINSKSNVVSLVANNKAIKTRRKPDIKYRDPVTGANWTGRGKIPNWIKESGKQKESFLIAA